MKNEKAIEILNALAWVQGGADREETIIAISMAIGALSKPNYESDTEVRLAVTDRNKDKVILWDAFGEVEYYPNGEINCVHCPRYYEIEDDIGLHSHCRSHGRLIDANALMEYCSNQKTKTISNNDIARFPTVSPDRPQGEWILECDSEGEGDNLYRCSECGCEYGCQEYDKPNFCLDCGVRMTKGGENE